MKTEWQRARLIPVVGNSSGKEREQRATSALLAVLGVVRPFSQEVLSPLGASKASKAIVDAYIEPPFKDESGKAWRPDGLIRVSFGSQAPWTALVEVKTGTNLLEANQLNAYIGIARREGFDHVISISNEVAPSIGFHPTAGLNLRKNSKVKVSHFSWTRIAALASRVRDRSGVEDVEQEWILQELLRYLEHQSSGAMEFDDMGPAWTSVKDEARAGTLSKRSPGLPDIATRWDQFLTYAAMKLSIRISEDVEEVLPRAHRIDPAVRQADFMKELVEAGSLSGSLRVPRTAGDVNVTADLRARQICATCTLPAPSDKKAKGSLSWLTKQLEQSPPDTVIESYPKGSAHPVVATLRDILEDPSDVLAQLPGDVARFSVVLRRDLSVNRTGSRAAGFADSALNHVFLFYDTILQNITPYQEKAPRASAETIVSAERELGSDNS